MNFYNEIKNRLIDNEIYEKVQFYLSNKKKNKNNILIRVRESKILTLVFGHKKHKINL